jgi:hypothetical protein
LAPRVRPPPGTPSGNGGLAPQISPEQPAVALDLAGRPAVAYRARANTFNVFVVRWNGTTWEELGGSGDGVIQSPAAAEPAVAIDDTGRPLVAWTAATAPSVALLPTGEPAVAWEDVSSGAREIYLQRWSGTAWVEIAGSASGGGLSNGLNRSVGPSIAADGNEVCVAWSETAVTGSEVVLTCAPLGAP